MSYQLKTYQKSQRLQLAFFLTKININLKILFNFEKRHPTEFRLLKDIFLVPFF
jgi:hypothetical protein